MAKAKVQEEISPNLIPMIDIMFLLLLFFMLGADMGQRELEEVVLPLALAVREEKEVAGQSSSDKVVVNVYHDYAKCPEYDSKEVSPDKPRACFTPKHWKIGIRGHNLTDLKKLEHYLMNEANAGRAEPAALSSGKPVTASERPVTVHADAMAPYGQVQEVINTCAKVGIYKIECGAARPPEGELVGSVTAPAAAAKN